jgi:hypothetical protein
MAEIQGEGGSPGAAVATAEGRGHKGPRRATAPRGAGSKPASTGAAHLPSEPTRTAVIPPTEAGAPPAPAADEGSTSVAATAQVEDGGVTDETGPAHDRIEDEGQKERTRGRQFDEIGTIGRAILKREVFQANLGRKMTEGEELSTGDLALLLYDQIDTGKFLVKDAKGKYAEAKREKGPDGNEYYMDASGNPHPIEFTDGNPLVMPRLTETTAGGDALEIFADGEVDLARVVGMTPDGQYICEFAHPGTGDTVMEEGSDDTPMRVVLDRKFLTDRQIESEIDVYQSLVTNNPAYQTYLQTVTSTYEDFAPSDNFDAELEAGASEAGLPTSRAITEIIDHKYPPGEPRPPQIEMLLAELEGDNAIVLSREKFASAMKTVGIGPELITKEIDILLEARGRAAQNQDESAVAEIDAQMVLLNKVKNAWKVAGKEGRSPVDICYDEMREGRMNFGSLADAIKGDTSDLLDFFKENPQLKLAMGMSEAEQRGLVKLIKDHKSGLLWTLIVALGIPLAVAVGTAAASVQFTEATLGAVSKAG